MFRFVKTSFRDLIPLSLHVPLKFWYSYIRGYTEPEMFLLKKIIKPGNNVIDVGGNQGIYSYFISKFCKNIQIFEPNSACFEKLKSWTDFHQNIFVHNAALSDKDGAASLLIPIDKYGIEHDSSASLENNNFQNTRIESTKLMKLDSYNFKKIDFIKIDVEGHEFSLIRGGYNTIKDNKPCMLIEIEQRHNKEPISQIFDYLRDLGYLCFFLDDGKLLSFSEFNINIHQQQDNLYTKDKYINNFLFFDELQFNQGRYSDIEYLIK